MPQNWPKNCNALWPGRYLCRRIGYSTPQGPWEGHLTSSAPINTVAGHHALVMERNRQEAGHWAWSVMPVLPGDIDWPQNWTVDESGKLTPKPD